jgi:hypothetical protein
MLIAAEIKAPRHFKAPCHFKVPRKTWDNFQAAQGANLAEMKSPK